MKITVLIDNLETEGFTTEWGLSLYVENNGRKIILDTGTSGRFTENAEKLGIDLSQVDYGVLSHAHYDHSDGYEGFFRANAGAPFYLREGAGPDCFVFRSDGIKYIGVNPDFFDTYGDRIRYVSGDYEIEPGVWLIPHKMSREQAEKCGKDAKMYRCTCGCRRMKQEEFLTGDTSDMRWEPDTFDHEQSLVLDSPKGLVIINGCCHGGADQIIKEVAETFPDKHIYTLIGGFHLFRSSDEEIEAFIKRVDETGIGLLCTGHCTGDRAMELLREHMGDKVVQIRSGLVIEI